MYNYRDKLKVSTTPNGDKVITMSKEIYVALLNYVFDASEYQTEHGRQAIGKDAMDMWKALNDKWEYK